MRPREYIHQFCAAPDTESRDFLHQPVRFAGSLYACDGAVMICTEDDPAVKASNYHALIIAVLKIEAELANAGPFVPLPTPFPDPVFKDAGYFLSDPITIGHSRFHYYYLNLIKQLPEVEISPHSSDPEGMAYFHFVGGWGALAPVVVALTNNAPEELCAA